MSIGKNTFLYIVGTITILALITPLVISALTLQVPLDLSDYVVLEFIKGLTAFVLIFSWYFHRTSSTLRFSKDLYSSFAVLGMLVILIIESSISILIPNLFLYSSVISLTVLLLLYLNLHRKFFANHLSDLLPLSLVIFILLNLFLYSQLGFSLFALSTGIKVLCILVASIFIACSAIRIQNTLQHTKEVELLPVLIAFISINELLLLSKPEFVISASLLTLLLIIVLIHLALALSIASARDWSGFHMALDASSEAFCSANALGKVLYVNDAFKKLFGYEELTPKSKIIHPLNTHPIKESLDHKLASIGKWEGETSLLDLNGEAFPVHISIKSVELHDNPVHQIWITSLKDKQTFINKEQIMLEKLEKLSFNLIEKQEEERRFFAKELHDEIGQGLTLIKIQHQLPEPDNELITSVLSELIDKVRNLSLNLRPSILDDMGLPVALEWLVDRQKKFTGLDISCDVEHEIPRMSDRIEISVFRVVQEAFTNIHKYAHATNARLKAWCKESVLYLEIQDDGVGFDVNSKLNSAVQGKSLGILGIQERIFLVGGTVNIDSTPQHGTNIIIRVPVKSKGQVDE